MKTITLFCLALLFLVFSAHSQISKGSVLLGGNIGFSSGSVSNPSDEYKNHSYFLSPSLGFVVKENKVVGFSLLFGHGIYENVAQKNENDQYGGSIFYRSYLPLGKGFYLYGQGVAGTYYYKSEEHTSSNDYIRKQTSTSLSLFPGVAYAISKRFHLEIALNNMLNLNYNTTKHEYANAGTGGPSVNKSSGFGFDVNASPSNDLSLGFRVLLGNK